MREIPGWEGRYAVDEEGNIWSLGREVVDKNGMKRPLRQRKLKAHLTTSGYLQVALCRNSKAKSHSVHRLLGRAFLDLPSEMDISHIDGDKTNNSLSNLEVYSRSENCRHGYRIGLTRRLDGLNHPMSCVNKEFGAPIMRAVALGLSSRQTCEIFNLKRSTVHCIMSGNHYICKEKL
jgi:HNH endonuclease/NUMOD4 motif